MRQLSIQDCTTAWGRGYKSPKQPHKYGTRQLGCRPGISTKLLPTATSYDSTSQATIASAAAQTSLQQPTINRSQSRATSKTATRTSHRAPRQVQKALSNRVSKNDNRTHWYHGKYRHGSKASTETRQPTARNLWYKQHLWSSRSTHRSQTFEGGQALRRQTPREKTTCIRNPNCRQQACKRHAYRRCKTIWRNWTCRHSKTPQYLHRNQTSTAAHQRHLVKGHLLPQPKQTPTQIKGSPAKDTTAQPPSMADTMAEHPQARSQLYQAVYQTSTAAGPTYLT